MLINVVAKDPDLRVIQKIIKILNNDGLIVIPTDTIYAFATSIKSKKGLSVGITIRPSLFRILMIF